MQFNTLLFAAFFAVVLVARFVPQSWRARKRYLLWLSYLFYAAWNPPFIVLLWVSTLVDWFVGRRLHASPDPTRRRWLLGASIAVNLGMLSYFKYSGFILENLVAVVQSIGIDWQPLAPSIVLPIGISFYTFQTLSYSLDIYFRRLEPCDSFLDYALFVTFFPQLVAGPIVRAKQFLPQTTEEPEVTTESFSWGLYLLVLGIFEKRVVADFLLAPTVEAVYDSSAPATALDGWVASAACLAQMFGDFAGYSLAAIGVALCLGFELPINFRFPLAAVSFTDFWRRWHISLSSWMRDYVYRPLGGAEGGPGRGLINVLLTTMVIGLWHGAAWTYVLWGAFCGLLLVLERAAIYLAPPSRLWSTTPMLFVFALIQFAGISLSIALFRSSSLQRTFDIGSAMLTGAQVGTEQLLRNDGIAVSAAVVGTLFLFHWFMRDSTLEDLASRTPWVLKSAALAIMLISIVLATGVDRAYIYFQF